jgi:pimeloyl-ACP methyl ester carboxylesterase
MAILEYSFQRIRLAMNLQTIATPPRSSVRSFGGAEVSFRDFGGRGRPLVFAPGWICRQEWWDPAIAELGPRVRAITFDYPGVGGSTPGHRQWAIENFARDIRSIIEWIDLRELVVVGHSMGGAVALETAYLCFDRISRVIGCDTYTYGAFYPRFDERQIDSVLGPYRQDFSQTVRRVIGVYFLPGGDAALAARVSEAMADASPENAISTMEHFLRWDLDASLRRCPVPVSTINARHFLDPVMEERYGSIMNIRTIDGVGHFLMMEKPREFARAVIDIIENDGVVR